MPAQTRLRSRPSTLAVMLCLVIGALVVPRQDASAAQTIGYPTFTGPAVPAPPIGYRTGNMMQAIYDAESTGTDFWIDRLLGRSGSDPSDVNGGILMTRGRALFMKTHTPGTLGFAGKVAYIESIDDRSAFTVSITPGNLTEQVSQRWQGPSHFRSVHTAPGSRWCRRSSSPTTTWPSTTWRSPTPGPPPRPCNCGPPRRTPPPAQATS